MKRFVLGVILVGAATAANAAAQDPNASPNASERGWIAACVKKNTEAAPAEKACVGVVLGACLDSENAPKSLTPSIHGGLSSGCAALEAKIWDELLNRWYAETAKKIPPAALDKLRAAQRAWIAYRDAGCAVAGALHGFALGEANEAHCLMQQTARRALEMRDLAEDDYEDQ